MVRKRKKEGSGVKLKKGVSMGKKGLKVIDELSETESESMGNQLKVPNV